MTQRLRRIRNYVDQLDALADRNRLFAVNLDRTQYYFNTLDNSKFLFYNLACSSKKDNEFISNKIEVYEKVNYCASTNHRPLFILCKEGSVAGYEKFNRFSDIDWLMIGMNKEHFVRYWFSYADDAMLFKLAA